jgi:hypothetical protein
VAGTSTGVPDLEANLDTNGLVFGFMLSAND